MKLVFALLSLLVMMAGCQTATLQSNDNDNAAKHFTTGGGQATIYIYRLSGFASALRVEPVFIDGRMLGQNGSGTFLATKVSSGHHTVSTTAMSINIEAKPPVTYFVRQKMSVWVPTSSVEPVTEEEGEKGVSNCQQAVALF